MPFYCHDYFSFLLYLFNLIAFLLIIEFVIFAILLFFIDSLSSTDLTIKANELLKYFFPSESFGSFRKTSICKPLLLFIVFF